MNNNKKKITTIVLLLAFLAIAVTGGTLAYFTDTDDATNTFTAGNVAIDLTEAKVEKDAKGNLIAAANGERNDVSGSDSIDSIYDYGKIYPGQTIYKDPTIENTGSEDAYIAAKIIVNDGNGDIEKLIGTGYNGLLGINEIVKGGYVKEHDTMKTYNGLAPVYGDATYSVYQEVETLTGGDKNYVFYIFVEDPQETGDKVTLFDTIKIPSTWDNEEMAEMKELKIKVEAYATQAYGFDSCFNAMTAAFDEEFEF